MTSYIMNNIIELSIKILCILHDMSMSPFVRDQLTISSITASNEETSPQDERFRS